MRTPAACRAAADCNEPTWNRAGLLAALEDYWPKRTPRAQPRRAPAALTDVQIAVLRNAPEAVAKRARRRAS